MPVLLFGMLGIAGCTPTPDSSKTPTPAPSPSPTAASQWPPNPETDAMIVLGPVYENGSIKTPCTVVTATGLHHVTAGGTVTWRVLNHCTDKPHQVSVGKFTFKGNSEKCKKWHEAGSSDDSPLVGDDAFLDGSDIAQNGGSADIGGTSGGG